MYIYPNVIARLPVILAVVVLGACATTSTKRVQVDPALAAREAEVQKEMYVKTQLRDQKRVQAIAYPMLVNGAPICDKRTRPGSGFVFGNKHTWPKDFQDAAVSAFGVGEELQVLSVTPESPASRAGLKEGDLLLQFGDKVLPQGQKADSKSLNILQEKMKVGEPLAITANRDGETTQLSLTPDLVCDTLVVYTAGDEVNAYADGNAIYITSGMLRFVESDNELATVIGHEIAHNAMGHRDKKMTNFLLGSILDVAAAAYGVNTQSAFGNMAASAFSKDFEAEADYVGLYVMRRGGYSTLESPDFWRRMGVASPGSVSTKYSGTHPGTADRYIALDQVNIELSAKESQGQQLLPDPKK
jgi:hypothetical protein